MGAVEGDKVMKRINAIGNMWEEEDYFCPSCGEQTVFSGGGDDYYFGQIHLYLNCDAAFYLPLAVREANDNELMCIKILKEKTKEIE